MIEHNLKPLRLLALGSRLRLLSEQMMAIVRAFYEDNQLAFEPRWFPLFRLAHDQPGIGMTAVAQQIGVSHAAVNAFCKQMLDAGLIVLTPDAKDGRIKQVALSEAGRVLFTRLEPAWFALQKALETAFPGETAQKILATLDDLDEAVADRAIQRGLKSALRPEAMAAQCDIVAYDAGNPDHKRYFAALNIEWLEAYFSVEPVDRQMFADPVATIITPGGHIVMAMVDGQIVGTCAVIRRSADVHEMAKMAVSRLYQGKGIGTRLIEAILDWSRARGLKTLYLVSSTKLPHAVPTYRKLGFVDCANGLHELYQRSDITLEKAL